MGWGLNNSPARPPLLGKGGNQGEEPQSSFQETHPGADSEHQWQSFKEDLEKEGKAALRSHKDANLKRKKKVLEEAVVKTKLSLHVFK